MLAGIGCALLSFLPTDGPAQAKQQLARLLSYLGKSSLRTSPLVIFLSSLGGPASLALAASILSLIPCTLSSSPGNQWLQFQNRSSIALPLAPPDDDVPSSRWSHVLADQPTSIDRGIVYSRRNGAIHGAAASIHCWWLSPEDITGLTGLAAVKHGEPNVHVLHGLRVSRRFTLRGPADCPSFDDDSLERHPQHLPELPVPPARCQHQPCCQHLAHGLAGRPDHRRLAGYKSLGARTAAR